MGSRRRTRFSRLAAAWRGTVPHGRTLPADAFALRHRRLQQVLWLHVLALPVLAMAMEGPTGHDVPLSAMLLAAFALASRTGSSTRMQSAVVATGLMTSSALVVHICDGALEAHFHFFVMMSILALYEDWLPYGLGTAYVFVHHLVMGLLMPVAAFGHPGGALGMAAVHAGFITASGVANVGLWRSNERARAGTAAALRRAEVNYEVTHVLAGAVTLADALPRLLDLVGSRLGFDLAVFWTPEPDGRRLVASGSWAADEGLAREARAHLDGIRLAPGAGVAGRAWATRTERPLALAVIDFDAFKAYNDAHAHLAGDAVLAAAGSRWRDALRPQDVLARYGGEEFVLLLPGCDLSEAHEIAERLRARTPRGQTCSVGLAMREPGEGADALVGRADAALYAAKAAGRDRIMVAAGLAALSPSP